VSWLDKIQTDLVITTGDGKEFRPQWLNATMEIEYNISLFNFPNLAGTRVVKGKPKGAKFNLELYFQGEKHLDEAEAFRTSASDSREWRMAHPLYGNLVVNPTGLLFDNTESNISKVTGTVIETILEDNPKISVRPQDKILFDKVQLDETFAQSFAASVRPNTADINSLKNNTNAVYNEGKKIVKTTNEAEEYFNAFNSANAEILNATVKPLDAIRKVQSVINHPFLFAENVKNRIRTLVNQFNRLSESVMNLVRPSEKRIFENIAGSLISSMAAASVTRPEYENRSEVINTVEAIISSYHQYLYSLDGLQTKHAATVESYIPDVECMIALNDLVSYTVSKLFEIALDSKQERTIILEDDSNIIVLTHRVYGLTADDSTIESFIRQNNFGVDEYFQIKKGRKIVYYV
jgi:hypothetical protein